VVKKSVEQLPVAAARAGSPEAWDALFRRYQLPLYTYVFELIRHEQSSLDVVQETFINASRHLGGLREDDKFGGWLFGIAHQKCVQRWRRTGREESCNEELTEDLAGAGEGPDEVLLRREQEEEFMEWIARLPSVQRAVILLHYLEEFSLEEIAQIIGTQVGTVKSRLHYAKRALRKRAAESPCPR
jgi:RNA polymerase sigma-70 factor (ECF subfamily)